MRCIIRRPIINDQPFDDIETRYLARQICQGIGKLFLFVVTGDLDDQFPVRRIARHGCGSCVDWHCGVPTSSYVRSSSYVSAAPYGRCADRVSGSCHLFGRTLTINLFGIVSKIDLYGPIVAILERHYSAQTLRASR